MGQTASFFSMAKDPNKEFRAYMEDGHKVVDPLLQGNRTHEDMWSLFAVYDGHGGRNEVDYCEAKLHDVVLAELRDLGPGAKTNAQGALTNAFKKIDGQLAMLGAWNSGCTATVALAHRQGNGLVLYVANVGDSRAVIVGGPSGARRVSVDHRACDPEEAKRVAQDGGIVRHGRVGGQLSVSRSLGDHHLKSSGVSCIPDVSCCSVPCDGDALVIASDGLWDALSDEDAGQVVNACIEQAVAKGGGEQAVTNCLRDTAAQTMVDLAKQRGSRDNILALIVFF